MATETLRPNAQGDECNIYAGCVACPDHYTCVDEEVADDSATWVGTGSDAWERDLYNVENHSIGFGVVNHIKIHVRSRSTAIPDRNLLKICIKTGGTAYEEEIEFEAISVWRNYSAQWDTNPQTERAWSRGDIDALQIGIALRDPRITGGGSARCTQIYVEVDYTPLLTNPLISKPLVSHLIIGKKRIR